MSERVVFREFSSRGAAEVVRELLVANGIEAFVISDDCGSMDPALSFARGVRLLVAADDLAVAEETIAAGMTIADDGNVEETWMVTIEKLHDLPPALLAELVAEAELAGLRFPCRLVVEWTSGANRFDRPGEALFAARVDGQIVGVCGLNRDPYTAEARVGRVRHLYVLEAHRRHGVGRRLVAAVMAAACSTFDRLRLRTNNPEAASLYEAMGFSCVGEADCTHALDLRGVQADGG